MHPSIHVAEAEDEFTRLKREFQGELLDPAHARYEQARRVWNARVDRRPALIARCSGVADVRAALKTALTRGVPLAIRGGGHDIAGNGVCDGGLVLDLSPMKEITIDPVSRIARVQGGVLWSELDRQAQRFGLATTGGQCSSTGVIGVTIGGGIGWLMRRYGLCIDNLLSAELVTVEGQLLRASAHENPDLYWGLRGGGGNFGVVTSIELRLHPVDRVIAGVLLYPGSELEEVLRFYSDFALRADDSLAVIMICLTASDHLPIPAHYYGSFMVALAVCYCGPLAEAEPALRPLRKTLPPVADLTREMSYYELQSMFESAPAASAGFRHYQRSEYLARIGEADIAAIARYARAMTSPQSAFELSHLGGAIARVAEDDTAFSHRKAPFFTMTEATWRSHEEDPVHMQWVRGLWQELRGSSFGGTLPGFVDGDEPAERIREIYGEAKYQRLAALKRKYDPANLLRMNKNIKP
jgi:FAD/FMN-containing dehydrogenase